MEQANEIQESLGRSYAVPDEIDEADLEAGMYLPLHNIRALLTRTSSELDALQFDEEEEGTSYLADINKVPDFIDEPPVEVSDVSGDNILMPLATNWQLPNLQAPSKEAVKTSA